MIPRIQASETLDAATAVALGSGVLKKGDAHRITSSLERRAGQSRVGKANPALLAAMGIGVEVIDG